MLPASGLVAMVLAAGAPASGLIPVWELLDTLEADHLILVDPARGFGPVTGTGGLIRWNDLEDTSVASVGKTWTLHMAFHALDEGLVTPGETITFGPAANAVGCNCMVDTLSQTLFVGEQFAFWDAVMGSYIRSANDLTVAYAEHIGLRLAERDGETCSFDWPSPQQTYPSTCLVRFLDWASAHLHSGFVGASATTVFYAPHGAGNTTSNDVALWLHHALQDPRFVEAASSTSWTFSNLQGNRSYAPTRGTPAIVGLEAWKHGNGFKCDGDSSGCTGASAVRIGRRMIAVVSQSAQTPDVRALFDWGYEFTFLPELRAISPTWKPVKDHAFACVGPTHAVSGVLDAANNPWLLLWNAGSRSLLLADEIGGPQVPTTPGFAAPALAPLPEPVDDLAALAWEQGAPAFAALGGAYAPAGALANAALAGARQAAHEATPVPTVGVLDLLQEPPVDYQQVEVAAVGPDRVVAAYRHGLSTLLSSWEVQDGALVNLDSAYDIGATTDVALAAVGMDRFVVVAQDLAANLRLATFRLTASGQFVQMAVAAEALPGKDFSVAVVEGNSEGIPSFVVVASRALAPDSHLQAHAWRLFPEQGHLAFHAGLDLAADGEDLRLAALDMLVRPGEVGSPRTFALATRDGGQLALRFLGVDEGAPVLSLEGQALGLGPVAPGEMFLGTLGPHSGLVAATRAAPGAGNTTLAVFEARRDQPQGVSVYPLASTAYPGVDRLEGLCRQRGNAVAAADGEYLAAGIAQVTGSLGLRAFWSGPRA